MMGRGVGERTDARFAQQECGGEQVGPDEEGLCHAGGTWCVLLHAPEKYAPVPADAADRLALLQ